MFKFNGRRFVAILLVIMLVISLAACSNSGNKESKETAAAGGAAAPTVVKVGIVTSKTGALQAYGEQMLRGFQMGLEYGTKGTNKVGNTEIQVIIEDSETKPEIAKQKAIKLLEEDKVDILVGSASSSDALAILPLAEEYKKVIKPQKIEENSDTLKGKFLPTLKEIFQLLPNFIRSSIIGIFIGILPGAGGDIGAWLS